MTTNRAIGATAGRVAPLARARSRRPSTTRPRAAGRSRSPRPGRTRRRCRTSSPSPTRTTGISKHHRWGPFRLTPGGGRRRSSASPACATSSSSAGRPDAPPRSTSRPVPARDGCSSQDFRRALDLRSTWFTVRVLNLDPPAAPRARRAAPWCCSGFVRGLAPGPARAAGERRHVATVAARPAAARTAASRSRVRPRGTTSYRLATAAVRRRHDHRHAALNALTRTYTILTRAPATVAPMRRYSSFCALFRIGRLALSAPAGASPYARYGIQDDAWLALRPGHARRAARRRSTARRRPRPLHAQLAPDRAAPRRARLERRRRGPAAGCARARDRAGRDALRDARAGRTAAARRTGRRPRGATFAASRAAAAKRYPFVQELADLERAEPAPLAAADVAARLRRRRCSTRPTRRSTARRRGAKVAGGVTAPRGSTGGVSPVDWIRGMRAAARAARRVRAPPVSARAGSRRRSTRRLRPLRDDHDGDARAAAPRGDARVRRGKRIWLTEYGYQTNPPDRLLGVSPALQARYVGEAARASSRAPHVDMLIHYLYRDEPDVGRWQSGLVTAAGVREARAARVHARRSRRSRGAGSRDRRSGARCARGRGGSATSCSSSGTAAGSAVGGACRTTARGFLSATSAPARARSSGFRYPPTRSSSPMLDGARQRQSGGAALEERPQSLLALVARPPLGDPARGLGPVERRVEDEPLRVRAPPAGRRSAARRGRARRPRRGRRRPRGRARSAARSRRRSARR